MEGHEKPTRKRSNSGSYSISDPTNKGATVSKAKSLQPPKNLHRKISANDMRKTRSASIDTQTMSPRGRNFSPKIALPQFASFFRRSSVPSVPDLPTTSPSEIAKRELICSKYENSTQEIVLLQSALRTFMVRKHFLVSTKHSIANRRAIFKCLQTLNEKEDNIIRVFKILQNSYAKPLRSKTTLHSVPKEALKILFFNTKILLSYHRRTGIMLKKMIDQWPIVHFGYAIATHVYQLSLLYNEFVANLQKAEDIVDQHFVGTLGKFFLRNKAREHADTGITTLKKLLGYPTTYLISYRGNILDILYAMSPFRDSLDYQFILKAAAMATQLQSTTERQIYSQDMEILCERLSRTLIGIDPLPNYNIPGRKFIREGGVTWKERVKLRLFLFSDILLITKVKGKKFRFIEEVPLSKVTHTAQDRITTYALIYYRISTPKTNYPLMERKASGFVNIFAEYAMIGRVRSLIQDDIVKHAPSLSPFVLKTIYYLDKARIKEGMFRASIKNFQNGLRLLGDELPKENQGSDFNKFHRDELAHSLLIYLQCLPREQRIPTSNFCDYMEGFYNEMPRSNALQHRLVKVLQNLPAETRNWFDYIIFFLERIHREGSVFSQEISVHFAYLFTIDNNSLLLSCKQAPIIARFIQILIENRNSIYGRLKGTTEVSLPTTANELVECKDFFNSWWSNLHSQEPTFIAHISTTKFYKEYLRILCKSKSIEQSDAVLVRNILATDSIVMHVLETDEILKLFFRHIIKYRKKPTALFHLTKLLSHLMDFDVQRICEYLSNSKDGLSSVLIMVLSSGSILHTLRKLIHLVAKNAELHPIALEFCQLLFENISDVFGSNTNGFDGCWILNACELLGTILHDSKFFVGPLQSKFIAVVDIHAATLVDYSLDCTNIEFSVPLMNMIKRCIATGGVESSVGSSSVVSNLEVPMYENKAGRLSNEEDDVSEELLMESHIESLGPHDDMTAEDTFGELIRSSENSESDGDGLNIRMNFINLLLDRSETVTSLMLPKEESPTLGVFRFCLVELVNTMVALKISTVKQRILDSEWIRAVFDLFFMYENHSILHDTVRKMVCSIGQADVPFFEYIIRETDFLERAADAEKNKKRHYGNYGHIVLIIQYILTLSFGKDLITTHPRSKTILKMKKITK